MSKRMNMVGGEGSRPQKEVFTPKSWKPVEGCGHNGCGFGDIVASRLLSISGSQFGSMHQEGKDSLPEPQCTNFSASWQMGWGFLWPVLLEFQWETEELSDTGAFSTSL